MILEVGSILGGGGFNHDGTISEKLNASLRNDKTFDWTKLKAVADDNIRMVKVIEFMLDRVEKVVAKGENTGYQHFLHFPQCFQTLTELLKFGIAWKKKTWSDSFRREDKQSHCV